MRKFKTIAFSLLIVASLLSTIFVVPASGATGSFGFTNLSLNNTINDVSYFGQSFTPTDNIYVTSANLWIQFGGYSGTQNTRVAIRSAINGSNLGESTDTAVGTSFGWYTFNFSTPVNLTNGTTYYLVISSTGGDLCYIYRSFGDPYAGGQRLTGSGSPTGYITDTGDIAFEIFYFTNSPPNVTNAHPSVGTLWPANNKFVDVNILGVTDPDGDTVTITINSITSDEPTGTIEGAGGKANAPDAIIGTGGNFQLRAERSGLGDGRVYIINFTANDGKGGVTPGSVKVGVPHDVNGTAVDSRGVGDVPSAGYDATVFN